MLFEIDEQVVCSSLGVGRIAALVTKRFLEDEAHLYYEIVIGKSTVWLLADAARTVKGLRPVTPKAKLAHYRDVLRSCPVPLAQNFHQRQLDLLDRLRVGSFQDMCEVVRDLSARGWKRPPGEMDSALLRKTRDTLCQEWMVSDGISLLAAVSEVTALLGEARQTYFSGLACPVERSRIKPPSRTSSRK
jgi:RNA polymerase-interacting CarD/CdnL/TRCF family regulator